MRELLFSVTKNDCDWTYYKASGAGGQARNKTSSAARCKHRDSGAVGQSSESRSQAENKRKAFLRMADTEQFKKWHRMEILKRNGEAAKIDEVVERLMQPKNLQVEVVEDGVWVKQ